MTGYPMSLLTVTEKKMGTNDHRCTYFRMISIAKPKVLYGRLTVSQNVHIYILYIHMYVQYIE